MRIHCIQHVPFEGLGSIDDWIKENCHELTFTKVYEDSLFPKINSFDFLIILGGPMGVYDENDYPWLVLEKAFIKTAIDSDKIVLGICLGAQLIATVLNSKVYKNHVKEIGWFPIFKVECTNFNNFIFNNENEYDVFHWHGDTFDLPTNSILLSSSQSCVNQAFIWQQKVVGLQFHLEVNTNSILNLIEFCGDELIESPFIQNKEVLLNQEKIIADNHIKLNSILEYLTAI